MSLSRNIPLVGIDDAGRTRRRRARLASRNRMLVSGLVVLTLMAGWGALISLGETGPVGLAMSPDFSLALMLDTTPSASPGR